MSIENLQPSTEPTSTINLWSPNTIGTFTFFLGFPSGITLASINWFKMGMKWKAFANILIGIVGLVIIFLIPESLTRSIALLINLGFVAYIRYQMKADIESLTDYKFENSHWFSGFLTSLVGWGFAVLVIIIIVSLEPIIPGTASYYYENGVNFSENGDYENAVANYAEAIRRDPSDIYSYNNRGLCHIYLGNYDLAIADFNKAIELDPRYDNAYYNRGLAYKDLGQIDYAIKDFQKVLELTSNPELRSLSEQELKNIETFAISSVHESVEHYNNGEMHYQEGDYENALAEFTKAIEFDPNYIAAYHYRSILYANLEQYDLAFADIDKAISLSPDNSFLHCARGILYRDIGNFERALVDQNKAIEISPHYADAYLERGVAYGNLGDQENAFADFNKAIELDPHNPISFYNRGTVYYINGKYTQAINDFNEAIELDPEYTEVYNSRGVTYAILGDSDQAMADFNKVLELEPNDILAYFNRGLTYKILGNINEAIRDFERALELSTDPQTNQQIEEILQELREQ